VFSSVIIVDECNIIKPSTAGSLRPTKSIKGVLLGGEWERLIGCVGMVINAREFGAQLAMDKLSFMTTPLMDTGRYLI
jgi:hypothetical protein